MLEGVGEKKTVQWGMKLGVFTCFCFYLSCAYVHMCVGTYDGDAHTLLLMLGTCVCMYAAVRG